MAIVDPTSSLLSQSLSGPPPHAPVSRLILAVQPLAVIPTSSERIQAQGDAIRHRGLSLYA